MPTSSSPSLRAYAETPDRYALLSADVERFDDGRVCIVQGATFATVSGVRVPPDGLAALVDEVRARTRNAPRRAWELGPSTLPRDAVERLRALGLRDPDGRPLAIHALALTAEPTAGPRAKVLRVCDLETFVAAREVQWDAFERDEAWRERERPHLAAMWRAQRDGACLTHHLALLDGRPAGTASSVHSPRGSFLIGGAVAPWARGHGLYRALVRARWDEAAERGAPCLVVHALPDTSLPILLRLGFEEVCVLDRLEDPYSSGSTPPVS